MGNPLAKPAPMPPPSARSVARPGSVGIAPANVASAAGTRESRRSSGHVAAKVGPECFFDRAMEVQGDRLPHRYPVGFYEVTYIYIYIYNTSPGTLGAGPGRTTTCHRVLHFCTEVFRAKRTGSFFLSVPTSRCRIGMGLVSRTPRVRLAQWSTPGDALILHVGRCACGAVGAQPRCAVLRCAAGGEKRSSTLPGGAGARRKDAGGSGFSQGREQT